MSLFIFSIGVSELSQARILGGVGSILMLLSFVPSVGGILGIIGVILVIIAVKYVSDAVGDRRIFNNMLISVLIGIIGVVAGIIVGAVSVLTIFTKSFGMPPNFYEWFNLQALNLESLTRILVGIFIALIIIWVFCILSAIFIRRSFTTISLRLNIRLFSTAALLYLIGAALLIILVGAVLILVAVVLQTIAFFSMPESAPEQARIIQPM